MFLTVPARPFQQLQWAELRVTRQEFCREHFPNAVGPLFFCAMNDRQTGARPGFGDIGAPLVARIGNHPQLIGLAIAGAPNTAQVRGLTGFLNLGAHTAWLSRFTR